MDVYNCIFDDNYAFSDGGAAWLYDNCEITNCIFRNNSTGGQGGAVHLYMADITFENNLFYNNSADNGGALYIDYSDPSVVNCTFTQNNATDGDGGALYFTSCSTSVDVENCILWANTATGSGDQAYKYFAGTAPTYSYCDIQDCYDGNTWDTNLGTEGSGNIDEDPVFVDADNDDFHITGDSPCLDAADNTAITASDDLNWRTRIVDGPDAGATATVDIGCYEHHIIFVDQGLETGDDDGSSWANAFRDGADIQDANDIAFPGDEIWVAGGTYTLTSTIGIGKHLSIYGGFTCTEDERAERDPETNTTTIDGDETYRCFYVTAEATIDGFTIEDGQISLTSSSPHARGAAMWARKPVTIKNCIFNSNEIVDNDTSRTYSSTGGGALYLATSASPCLIINCEFTNNSATGANKHARGGAIYSYDTQTSIVNCLFYNNEVESDNQEALGGAVNLCDMSGDYDSEVINCTFRDNDTTCGTINSYGTGIYTCGHPTKTCNNTVFITNCILSNEADNEIHTYRGITATVTYCQLDDSTYDSNTGCNDSNPGFVSSTDHSLASNSPCIDTGDNNAIDDEYDTDLAGETRKVDGDGDLTPTVDKGCYEYQL